jgi:hypothetical protein
MAMKDAENLPCPECEKLTSVSQFSQKIGEFLDWIAQTHGVVFSKYHTHSDEGCYDEEGNRTCGVRTDDLDRFFFDKEKLLAEFFEVDLEKVENERRALLEALTK